MSDRARPPYRLVLVWILAVALHAFGAWRSAADDAFPEPADRPGPVWRKAPFCAGEEMRFSVRYGILPGGSVTLTTDRGEDVELPSGMRVPAREVWRFAGRVETSKLVSIFYRVDDRIESLVDRRTFLPLHLLLEVDETVELGRREVVYDHLSGIAHYRKDREFHKRLGPEVEEREDDLDPDAIDGLGLLFMLRRVELRAGDVFYQTIHENGKNHVARIEVGEVERIHTPLEDGKVPAIPLKVRVSLGKKLEARRDVEIWISDDLRRVPLRFEADLKVGSLKGVLVDYAPGDGVEASGKTKGDG